MASNKRLNATITLGAALSGTFKSVIGQTRMQLGTVGQSIGQLTSRQRELNSVIRDQERLGAAGSALRVSLANQELGAINKQIEALRKRNSILAKGAEMRAGGTAMMASGGLMIGGAVAMAATLGAPARAAADLEHKLRQIGNTASMTKTEIAALSDQIFRVSKASNQSTDDVTRAVGFLVAAGMDVKTAVASLETVSKGATAAGADVEDLAKAAFTLNDSMGIAPEKLNEALNILAKAGKQGNVELKDMAKQLPVLGAGFKALKMEGPEAAATMGAALQIARKGAADADEAANNMKNFIAKVMSPETLKKAKKEFGIDLYKIIQDAQTKGENPFEASMQAIIKATKGDQKAIGELFGDMQVQNFIRPMIEKWEDYLRIKRQSMTPEDVLAEDFANMMDTMTEATKGLGNAWKRLMIQMGTTTAPVIGDLARSLTGVLDGITAFTKANPEAARTTMLTVGAATALVGVLGAARLAAGATMYALGAVPATITTVGNALRWMATTAIPPVLAAMKALTLAGIRLLLTPIGATVTALALGGILVYKYWDKIEAKFNAIGESWRRLKAAVGFGDSTPAQTSPQAAAAAVAPPIPAMRAGGANVTNNVTNAPNITINQQPGQDNKALVAELRRELDRQNAVAARGRLHDMALGY